MRAYNGNGPAISSDTPGGVLRQGVQRFNLATDGGGGTSDATPGGLPLRIASWNVTALRHHWKEVLEALPNALVALQETKLNAFTIHQAQKDVREDGYHLLHGAPQKMMKSIQRKKK